MLIACKEWALGAGVDIGELSGLAEMSCIQTELSNFRDILTWFNSSNYILKIMFHSMYSLLKVKKHPHLFESLGVPLCFWTAVFISPICTYFYSTVEHHNRQQKLFMSILQMPISSSLWIKRCIVQPGGISHICPSC